MPLFTNTSNGFVEERGVNVCDMTPQHADSEGALPASMRPVQPAASISTLASSIGESEAERPSMEDYEYEEEEEDEEDDSLERLSPSDSEESTSRTTASCKRGLSRSEALEREDVFEEGSDPDEIVMEDHQVADFAASMLEAISCWHTRAQALLSLGGTTVRLLCPLPRLLPSRSPRVSHTFFFLNTFFFFF